MESTRSGSQITKEEVIAKLKDDGDFDRLRLKIIRKLKDDEHLRETISSIVKKSEALNRSGSENMKPRQLSDAIYQEVGGEVMSQISDGLWGIIRSNDGMKSEITETVQSVYDRLMNPKGKVDVDSSTSHIMPVQKAEGNKDSTLAPAIEVEKSLSEYDPKEPPGFAISDHANGKNEDLRLPLPHVKVPLEEQRKEPSRSRDKLKSNDVDRNQQPSFAVNMELEQPGNCSDEDPEVPPGFG
ncbi:hypothetical protein UlMin_042580 [Ulmus minor]